MDDVATLWPSGQGVCDILIVALPTDNACLSIRDGGVSGGSPVAEPCLSCTPQLDVEVRLSQHAHDTCAAFVFFFSVIATCRDVLLVEPRVHFPGVSDALRGEPCVEAIKGPKFDPHFLEYVLERELRCGMPAGLAMLHWLPILRCRSSGAC